MNFFIFTPIKFKAEISKNNSDSNSNKKVRIYKYCYRRGFSCHLSKFFKGLLFSCCLQ